MGKTTVVLACLWFAGFVACGEAKLFGQANLETRTGCLMAGSRAGTFVLIDEVTGQRVNVTGTGLDRYAARGGRTVTATGTMRQGAAPTFQITSVEPVRDTCGPIGFSLEALKEDIGRARVGIRGGVGIDPELVTVGAQIHLGPVIRSLWFRPTTEFAFGEVTKVYSINGDFAYYLPFTSAGANQQNRWNTYAGGGPAFTILRRDFEGFPDRQPVQVDSDWDSEVGLSFFFGVAQSNGLFMELRAAAYHTPDVRFYLGYVFRR